MEKSAEKHSIIIRNNEGDLRDNYKKERAGSHDNQHSEGTGKN